MSSYPTQAGAELAAREVVMRDKAELLIHSHTGQIRDRPAYTRHDRATSPADRAELDPYPTPPTRRIRLRGDRRPAPRRPVNANGEAPPPHPWGMTASSTARASSTSRGGEG